MCLQKWLSRFGYLPKASAEFSTLFSAEMLSEAISEMQRFYNLEVTGQLDQQTIAYVELLLLLWRINVENFVRLEKDADGHLRTQTKLIFTGNVTNQCRKPHSAIFRHIQW